MGPTEKHDEINKNKESTENSPLLVGKHRINNIQVFCEKKTRKGPFHMYTVQYTKQLLYIF
jgi:hypothetical protein